MNRRFLLLVAALCVVASVALAQDAAEIARKAAITRKVKITRMYLAARAKLADEIEARWRDRFEKTMRLPGEDKSKDASEAPALDAPAKEHLGISDPDTLTPRLQKELTRLVKLSSSRELDRSEKREVKKQATKVRVSLAYIKRNQEEFQKAFRGRRQKLEKLIREMKESPLVEHFMLMIPNESGVGQFEIGQLGLLPAPGTDRTNLTVRDVYDDQTAVVYFSRNKEYRVSGASFVLRGIPTDGWKKGSNVRVKGFFCIYANVGSAPEFPVFFLVLFDPVAAMKEVEK